MVKMPSRKEPKETVVYPASKRKALPFKPQRPSKVPRIPTTDSESTQPSKITQPAATARQKSTVRIDDDDDESEDDDPAAGAVASDSDEELDDNPLAAKSKKKASSTSTKPAPAKRKQPRQASPASPPVRKASNASVEFSPVATAAPPPLTQSDGTPVIPQPLLVRLLHEHFANKKTKIDKYAIQVLQKYFEVYVREAIARAQLQKQEDADKSGGAGGIDASWLELDDLEKVAAGMLMDF